MTLITVLFNNFVQKVTNVNFYIEKSLVRSEYSNYKIINTIG